MMPAKAGTRDGNLPAFGWRLRPQLALTLYERYLSVPGPRLTGWVDGNSSTHALCNSEPCRSSNASSETQNCA